MILMQEKNATECLQFRFKEISTDQSTGQAEEGLNNANFSSLSQRKYLMRHIHFNIIY